MIKGGYTTQNKHAANQIDQLKDRNLNYKTNILQQKNYIHRVYIPV